MYRYHANRLGRFTSPDPVNGSPANPQSLNRYAYTMNDPVNQSDPNGLCTINVICTIWPPRCGVYESCGPPIPRPESPDQREIFRFGFGFDIGGSVPDVTCDQPEEKIIESRCTNVHSAGSILRSCGYVSICGILSPGVTAVPMASMATACKVPISKVKCPTPPGDIQIFARLSFYGAIAKVVRVNVQSTAFK
jgi:hypothetical protein